MGSNVVSGFHGGVVAIVIGAVLIATDVIDVDNGGSESPRQGPLASPRPDAPAKSGGLSVHDIYVKTGPGVAYIQAEIVQTTSNPFGLPQQQRGEATGSGFVLNARGYVATNAHVVSGARTVHVRFGEGRNVTAKIVGSDPSTDLAVIKVDPSKVKLTPVPLGNSSRVPV